MNDFEFITDQIAQAVEELDQEPDGLEAWPAIKAARILPPGPARVLGYKASLAAIVSRFQDGMRAIARGAVVGEIPVESFIDQAQFSIERRWFDAFRAGLEVCGVEDEITEEERSQVLAEMVTDLLAVAGLGNDIAAGKYTNPKGGAMLKPLFARINLYTTRLKYMFALGQSSGCANKMMEWELGATEDHCADCLFYAGQVHRMSTWTRYNALPQARGLECGGWNCDCRLTETAGKAVGRMRAPSGS